MPPTTVTFAGTGDTLGSGGRLQTCFHVDAPETTFLLDCGASALPALKRVEVDLDSIETVLLTHLHGDHFAGLPFLVLDAQLRTGRTAPLTIAGPPGTAARVEAAMDVLFPGLSEVDQKFDVEYVEFADREPVSLGGVEVTPFRVRHPSGAPPFALRVDVGGKVLAYSGDTEWTDALVDAGRDADLFVCEAYFAEKSVPYHLDYATLREHLDEIDPARTVLTHMSEEMLAHLPDADHEGVDDGDLIVL